MAFKMKGPSLYKKGNENMADGRSKSAPFQHYVDDVPEHNDPPHSDDLQTDEEHKAGKIIPAERDLKKGGNLKKSERLYWPDGTKRTKREIFEYDETKEEEKKEGKKPPIKIYENGGKRKKNPKKY